MTQAPAKRATGGAARVARGAAVQGGEAEGGTQEGVPRRQYPAGGTQGAEVVLFSHTWPYSGIFGQFWPLFYFPANICGVLAVFG